MSWLFGRKKHKDSPPSSRDEQEEQITSDLKDDFLVVEKRSTSLPSDVGSQDTSYPSGLYPFIGGTPMNPALSDLNLPKRSQQVDIPHYLSGVPFKLCKQLERKLNDDLEMDSLRINEILSFIERLENQNYDYNFSHETNVIREMSSIGDSE